MMGAGTAAASSNSRLDGRLRYANPRDLPSFPSLGLGRDGAAANKAASLGWANQRAPAQPTDSATASAAAALARESRAPTTKAGVRGTPSFKRVQPAVGPIGETARQWGASAAGQAFKAHPPQQSSQVDAAAARGMTATALDRQRSLRAARLADAGAGIGARRMSGSSPRPFEPSYPDKANAAANALSAASLAHKPLVRLPADQSGAVPYTTMDRRMFTSHPPVKPEVDEKRRADVIHASALAMARRMYTQQLRVINAAKHASHDPNARRPATADDEPQPAQHINLQEAAYKLAQERLAKLHEEHQQNRDFYEYYGTPGAPQNRFAVRAKLRRRASSDGAVVEDRRRSQQIRHQMSVFSTRLSQVDEQKRRRDREAVLAAAQRNVQAQLKEMDKRVYAATGKPTPTLLDKWELKAHTTAQARSEARKDSNLGKIDVGGGLYLDRKTVDEIAAKRVQPIIDDIHEEADKERERRAAAKMEEETRQREVERERARDREIQEIHETIKKEQKEKDRLRRDELERGEKARRQEEKTAKAQYKQRLKAERGRKTEKAATESPTAHTDVATHRAPATLEQPDAKDRTGRLFHRPSKLQTKQKTPGAFAPLDRSPTSDASSPSAKVKGWLTSRFTRPRSSKTGSEKQLNFDGRQKPVHVDGTGSVASLRHGSSSLREVAMAGRSPSPGPTPRPGVFPHGDEPSPVSSRSSGSGEDFVEARDRLSERSLSMASPSPFHGRVQKTSGSPVRDSRFLENF